MTSPLPADVLELALQTLEAELVESDRLVSFRAVLDTTEPVAEADRFRWHANGQVCLERSAHGTLTFFLPAIAPSSAPRRLGTFDRHGRLLSLFFYAADGLVRQFKVRNMDGHFLGVVRGAASHLGWGRSDVIGALAGEGGFEMERILTFFRSVSYEDMDTLPPLDAPMSLPSGGGATILNVLARLGQDQEKQALRYYGPYPSDQLFFTLRESFICGGEVGANRERFTQGAEEAALHMTMVEAAVDWRPAPHERFYPGAHTCVQLRNGVEKVYDHGHTYYRADLVAEAHRLRVLQTEEGQRRYIASLTILGQGFEDHLVLDEHGEILERLPQPVQPILRGDPILSPDWKAALVRLIAAESTKLLHAALWPAMDELTILWGRVPKELWALSGNELVLHAGMIAVHQDMQSRANSAAEKILIASRFLSELARLVGPVIRSRAQAQLASLSPADQNVALLFAASDTPGLSDDELRAFLTDLAQGEELPLVQKEQQE